MAASSSHSSRLLPFPLLSCSSRASDSTGWASTSLSSGSPPSPRRARSTPGWIPHVPVFSCEPPDCTVADRNLAAPGWRCTRQHTGWTRSCWDKVLVLRKPRVRWAHSRLGTHPLVGSANSRPRARNRPVCRIPPRACRWALGSSPSAQEGGRFRSVHTAQSSSACWADPMALGARPPW